MEIGWPHLMGSNLATAIVTGIAAFFRFRNGKNGNGSAARHCQAADMQYWRDMNTFVTDPIVKAIGELREELRQR